MQMLKEPRFCEVEIELRKRTRTLLMNMSDLMPVETDPVKTFVEDGEVERMPIRKS